MSLHQIWRQTIYYGRKKNIPVNQQEAGTVKYNSKFYLGAFLLWEFMKITFNYFFNIMHVDLFILTGILIVLKNLYIEYYTYIKKWERLFSHQCANTEDMISWFSLHSSFLFYSFMLKWCQPWKWNQLVSQIRWHCQSSSWK